MEALTMKKQRLSGYYPWSNMVVSDFAQYAHYLHPGQNLHTTVTLPGCAEWYRKPFPYDCTLHLPYLSPNMSQKELEDGDPITSLVTKKLQWQNQVGQIEKQYKKCNLSFEEVETAISSKCSRMQINRIEAFILHVLDQDPDPDFLGVTNWWYSGGRVSHLLVEGQMTLLTTSGEKNENLYAIPLTEESCWQPILLGARAFPTSSNEVIHQVTSCSKKCGRRNLIGVRQRNMCTITALHYANDSFEQYGSYEAKSKDAFTSLDLNPYKFGKFCTSDVNRKVSIWDAKKCSSIASHVVEKTEQTLSSSWCSVQYLDSNTVVIADTSTLMFLDLRQAFDKPSLTYCPQDQPSLLTSCEDVSLVFRSSSSIAPEKSLYCATSHHAFLFDSRNSKAVQRWTHMMRSPPLYGHSITTDTMELISIANQEPADVQLILNDWCDPNQMARSAVLPYSVPSLKNSRHAAHMSGQLLNPRAHSRFKLSIAGLTCLPAAGRAAHTIITQTSAGDVFAQELCKLGTNTAYTREDTEKLRVWEEQVLRMKSTSKLKLSGEYSNKGAVECMRNPNYKLPQYKKKIRLQKSLRCPKDQLLSYTDILASKLLEAWDIDDQSESHKHNSSSDILPINDENPPVLDSESFESPGISRPSSQEVEKEPSKKKRKAILNDLQDEIVPTTHKKKKGHQMGRSPKVLGF